MLLLSFFATSIFLLSIAFIIITVTKPCIDPELRKDALKKIKATNKLDPNLALIESHKILVNSIKSMYKNKNLNAAKVLRKVAKNLKNDKELWHYHRMRNKAAHEDDFKVSKLDAQKARQIFQKTLEAVQ